MSDTTSITSDPAKEPVEQKALWGGGRSPFTISYGKFMMWIFLLSDTFTFSALLIGYGFTRHSFEGNTVTPWPTPDQVFNHFPFLHGMHLPLIFVSVMTFILMFSSVTMGFAVEAGHRMAKKEVSFYMLLTILGGIGFLGCMAWEWAQFINGTEAGKMLADGSVFHGANLHLNEYGPTAFADLFFIVTGFHGVHVLSGIIINSTIYINVLKGTYEKRGHYEMVEKVGLYWHFVDLVWVFVFTFFYLI
ncbi:MAG: cytochrome oxidase subunit III [Bacteroidetes bacterium RIFCSPLOWO2_12_FULL_35_15]|nr:MAG: cytochrome oxidase subunit III [Bacteroidetes bacterium RIFCSPLOWO2_12_FULL_35_15]